MVREGQDGRYYKDCPQCGETQSYLRKTYAEHSEALGKRCKKCSSRDPDNSQHKGYYKGVLRASFVHKYRAGAEDRGIEWDVTFDYLADLLIEQRFKCALTGADIEAMASPNEGVNNTASLDRIDNSTGYVPGNVQWVTTMVNMCKHKYTQEEFIQMCLDVSRKYYEMVEE